MLYKTLTPRDVFTPRARSVNSEMYIHRRDLERQIRDALNGHRHFIIHGESGNGKTWLFKKVFDDTQTPYTVVNLALAAQHKSIDQALRDKAAILLPKPIFGESVEKDVGFKPGGVGASGKTITSYHHRESNPFLDIIRFLKGHPKRNSIVVFDNFERISNKPDLVEELANYLILLDDEDYGSYNVRICIVGVPGNLKEYFSQLPYAETIATRLTEIAEVERMKYSEAKELLSRGFGKLRLRHKQGESSEDHLNRLLFVSDRTAVELQDLGFRVGEKARRNEGIIETLDIEDVVSDWIAGKHSKTCSTIEALMSPAGLRNGRRNQILYCIGLIDTEEFDTDQLKEMIRRRFPRHSKWVNTSFDEKFGPFCEGFDPVVKKGMQGNSYRISKAVYRMAIRSMLKNDDNGGVYKISKKL